MITKPVERVWSGIAEVDELQAENERLQRLVDEQRNVQVAGLNAMIENRRLRALLDLESLAAYDRVTGEIVGSSPSNFDQRVEINRGSLKGIKVGMPVVNDAGLVGKITQVNPETSIVMLITDPLYHVPVKVVAEVFPTPTTVPPVTVPSGLPLEDVTTTTSTTTTTTTTVPETTGPDPAPTVATTTSTSTTTSSTTLPEPIEETRETGDLNGFGGDLLPRVRFIADSPQFGRIEDGDQVLTAGGSLSLAPPGIPVGTVANVIERAGTAGLELEVELERRSGTTELPVGHPVSAADRAAMIAALLTSSLTRVIPIGMMLLALQKTLFVELQPFGVIIQMVLAFAASAGAAGGPERGAITGFVLGIMFDLVRRLPARLLRDRDGPRRIRRRLGRSHPHRHDLVAGGDLRRCRCRDRRGECAGRSPLHRRAGRVRSRDGRRSCRSWRLPRRSPVSCSSRSLDGRSSWADPSGRCRPMTDAPPERLPNTRDSRHGD